MKWSEYHHQVEKLEEKMREAVTSSNRTVITANTFIVEAGVRLLKLRIATEGLEKDEQTVKLFLSRTNVSLVHVTKEVRDSVYPPMPLAEAVRIAKTLLAGDVVEVGKDQAKKMMRPSPYDGVEFVPLKA